MSFNLGFIAYDLYDFDQVDFLPWASISSFISGKGFAMTLALPGQWAVPTLPSSAGMSHSWPSSFPTGDPVSDFFLQRANSQDIKLFGGTLLFSFTFQKVTLTPRILTSQVVAMRRQYIFLLGSGDVTAMVPAGFLQYFCHFKYITKIIDKDSYCLIEFKVTQYF